MWKRRRNNSWDCGLWFRSRSTREWTIHDDRRFRMAKSNAATVQEYLEELPEDRRAVVSAVRDVVLANLPAGYREAMNYGMIGYEVPLERFPDTYNGQPLSYVCLAAQ